MSDERRYSEEEIAAIFEQAAQAQEAAHRGLGHGDGLTLAELQQIGREAGITPEFVARAAASMDRSGPPPPPARYLGLPISATRTVELPGPLTDAAWDRLVVDLRETFRATGTMRRDGSLREWRNGNLHALVEPTASGHRLRISTCKGSAQQSLTLGFASLAMGLVFLALFAANPGAEPKMMIIMALFVAFGLGGIGRTAFQLPRWVEERERQMEAIIARTVERQGEAPAPAVPLDAPVSALDLDALEEPAAAAPVSAPRRTRS
ncbi:MAG: hypothetical protein ABJF88_19415 [Rhodothermales bacterium]